MVGFVLLGILVLILLWAMFSYNRFVSLQRHVDEAWSGIAVQLKRRHDLIPNLVNVVQGYAAHEEEVLTEVTRMRASVQQGNVSKPSAEVMQSEGALQQALGKLMLVAEAYPELRANESFLALQSSLAEIEDHLQMARRYFNGSVRDYNILVESFPSLIIARMFSFAIRPFFELGSREEAAVPHVSFK